MKRIVTALEKLTEPCEPVVLTDDKGVNLNEAKEVVAAIKEVMEKKPEILALSAPQIGIKKRVFCIRFQDTLKAFVNPIITKKADFKISHETCASMPNKEIVVFRPEDITVVYYNDEIKYEENKMLGLAARLFDQQTQFFDGVTPADLGLVSDVNEDGTLLDCTEDELKEIYEFYKKYIAAKTENATRIIAEDEQLSKQYKQLKFTEDVITGKTQVIENPPHMNREQRRAAAKQAQRLKTKKAGK